MTFEVGNKLAAKGRRVEKMLERAIEQDDGKRLRQGVEKVLDLFSGGDKWAVEFVTNRLDGPPKQKLEISGDADNPLAITYSLVDAFVARSGSVVGRAPEEPAEAVEGSGEHLGTDGGSSIPEQG